MMVDSENIDVKLSAFEIEWLMVTLVEMDEVIAAQIHDKLHPPLYEYKMKVEEA